MLTSPKLDKVMDLRRMWTKLRSHERNAHQAERDLARKMWAVIVVITRLRQIKMTERMA